MTNQLTTRPVYYPSLLGRSVFDHFFNNFYNEMPSHVQKSTQGYPVADIFHDENGGTVMEFALAGFKKEELSIDVQPDKKSITVAANTANDKEENNRRIAKRNFQKTTSGVMMRAEELG